MPTEPPRQTTDPVDHGPLSFTWPLIGPAQHEAVVACLDAGDLSMPTGATARLEAGVRDYLGVSYAVAHANGTSAMLSALYAAGVEPGDEVVCPAYTWWASIAPVMWLGGEPVLCDIEPANLTVDLADLTGRVTTRTRAIVVPHLWGAAAAIHEVVVWARPRGIVVIEDASHAFGTTAHGAFLGTVADLGVFSLQAQKALPAGEGGLLVTNDAHLYERSLAVGHHERLSANPIHAAYAGTGLGLKLRMSPLNAALAASYLPTVEAGLRHQDRLLRVMLAPVQSTCDVAVVGLQPHVRHGGRTALKLVLPPTCDVAAVAARLTAVGLPSKPDYFLPLNQAPLFANRTDAPREAPPVTQTVAPRLLHASIPSAGSEDAAHLLGEAVAGTLRGEGRVR